ncbi:MAG: acylphosphatase [Candidatus Micrarchaeota archaeon]
MQSRLRIVVHGTVQGVFFRSNAEEQARRLGLNGWVRNKDDGSVEIVAEGPKEALQGLLDWCSRGPRGSVVEKIESEWLEPTGEFRDFQMRYD